MGKSLLPANASAVMRALSLVNAERFDAMRTKPGILATLWDAWSCPAGELKFLAWAFSVDYWNDAWPEARKRRVVAEALSYHRAKTTPRGVRMALGYRDAELAAYHLPRHGFFVDPGVDPGDTARWLATLPEIRIIDAAPFTLPGPPRRFVGLNCIARDDARLARTAVLIEHGTTTPLSIAPSGADEKIRAPISKQNVIIAGRAGSRYVAPSDLGDIVLAIRPVGSGRNDFVRPAATPGDAGAIVAAQRKLAESGFAVFTPVCGCKGGRFIVAPQAVARSYLSLRLSRQPGRIAARAPLNVVGRSRVPRPAFTAAWTVDWSRQLPRSHIPQGRKVFASPEPVVAGLRQAIQDASAARDRNALSLNATTRLTFADIRAIKAGTTFGQRKRIMPYV